MIKAVLFDIDGVLLDSFEAGFAFFGDVLAYMGRERPTRHLYRSAFHLPLPLALKHITQSELTEELERLHEIVEKVPYRTDLLAQPLKLRETLESLKRQYALGIVTNRNRDGLTKRYFSFAKTEQFFSVCINTEDVARPKPHPEPLWLAATRLNLHPAECVYVGDSHTDIEAGISAGMKTVLYGGRKNRLANVHTLAFKNLPKLIASLHRK